VVAVVAGGEVFTVGSSPPQPVIASAARATDAMTSGRATARWPVAAGRTSRSRSRLWA
jgi:hypothetical protein